MKLLVIHQENRFFGGAEVLLGQFLSGMRDSDIDISAAVVEGSKCAELMPQGVGMVALPDNTRFSLWSFLKQVRAAMAAHRLRRFDIIHGWAARDWELTAMLGRLTGKPVLGLLHDHPDAPHFPKKRRALMRFAGRRLTRIACVSHAVQDACAQAGYDSRRLVTVHNGIKLVTRSPRKNVGTPVRFGFLGVFSERKGLRQLFEMLSLLSGSSNKPWTLQVAGDAQDDSGRNLIEEIRQRYASESWWKQISWPGWIKNPSAFLDSIDLMVCPSSEFEPCPLVVCEAGAAGVPVLACKIGGIPEIVADNQTGWLYNPGDLQRGAAVLAEVLAQPERLLGCSAAAIQRISSEFNLTKMVAEYRKIYSNLTRNVWK